MKNLFNVEGKFMDYGTKVANLIILNFLTILFSAPIVTIGPALTAMHYTVFQIYRDRETSIWRLFWSSFRGNLKEGIAAWSIFLLLGGVLMLNYFFLVRGMVIVPSPLLALLYYVLLAAGTLVYLSVLSWTFVLLSRYQNSAGRTLKNALLISIGKPGKTIEMILLGLLPPAVPLVNMKLLVIPLICGFAVTAFLQVNVYKKVFLRIETQQNETIDAPNEGEGK